MSWRIDPTLPPLLLLDPNRLKQILLNLLNNACKFTKRGGVHLTLIGRKIEQDMSASPQLSSLAVPSSSLQSPSPKDVSPLSRTRGVPRSASPPRLSRTTMVPGERWQLTFKVRDTGIGLSQEHMGLLFNSFSQVQQSGETGGTGLGLVLSLRLAEKMNGTITVESELGVGSTFTVTLMCDVASEEAASPKSRVRAQSSAAMSRVTGGFSAPGGVSASPSPSSSPSLQVRTIRSPSLLSRSPSHSPSRSPGLRERRLSKAVNALPSEPTLCLYGLTIPERQALKGMKILFVGERNEPAEAWVALLTHYGCLVDVTTSPAEAGTILRAQIATAKLATTSSLSPPLESALSSEISATPVFIPPAILVDCDAQGVSEDLITDTLERTGAGASLCFLFLYSKLHMAAMQLPVNLNSLISAGPSTPEIRSNSNGSLTSVPAPLSMSDGTTTSKVVGSMGSPVATSWSPAAASRKLNDASAASRNGAGRGSDLPPPAMGTHSPERVSTPSSDGGRRLKSPPLAHPSVKRNLKKPFRGQQLLHALLDLSREDAIVTGAFSPGSAPMLQVPLDVLLPKRSVSEPELTSSVVLGDSATTSAAAAVPSTSSRDQAQTTSIALPESGSLLIVPRGSPSNEQGTHSTPSSGGSASGQSPATAGPNSSTGSPSQMPVRATSSSTAVSSTPPAPRSATSARSSRQSSTLHKLVPMSAEYPLRLLLAEDNLINQKMMVMILRKLGYEILVAANGREVLDIMEVQARKGKEYEVNCILMDASMDVMDGIECTRVIRAQQLPSRTRPFIIAQTANVCCPPETCYGCHVGRHCSIRGLYVFLFSVLR
jgi:CheY-like chemotaxis protein